jgi:hypothetical protein
MLACNMHQKEEKFFNTFGRKPEGRKLLRTYRPILN